MNSVLKLQGMKPTLAEEPLESNMSVACKKESTVSFFLCVIP